MLPKPDNFIRCRQAFGMRPDLISMAKQLSAACQPTAAVAASPGARRWTGAEGGQRAGTRRVGALELLEDKAMRRNPD